MPGAVHLAMLGASLPEEQQKKSSPQAGNLAEKAEAHSGIVKKAGSLLTQQKDNETMKSQDGLTKIR